MAIRPVRRDDLREIVAIDAAVTGIEKRAYWNAVFRRYGVAGEAQRQFLVAEDGGRVAGFVIGEVRDWEFGSPPCGWVFAIDVRPDARQRGIGARLLAAICGGLSARRRHHGAHDARARQHADPVVLPQPGDDGRAVHPAGNGARSALKLQKNTRLALYSVLEFALDPARHVAAAEIATKYGVSPHHLAKVLSELARAGVVESVRGVGGGYRFAGNARRLTLMDVIRMFEELSAPDGERREPGEETPVGRALSVVLAEIDEIATATFSSITIATMLRLLERQQRDAAPRAPAPRREAGAAASGARRRALSVGGTPVSRGRGSRARRDRRCARVRARDRPSRGPRNCAAAARRSRGRCRARRPAPDASRGSRRPASG